MPPLAIMLLRVSSSCGQRRVVVSLPRITALLEDPRYSLPCLAVPEPAPVQRPSRKHGPHGPRLRKPSPAEIARERAYLDQVGGDGPP